VNNALTSFLRSKENFPNSMKKYLTASLVFVGVVLAVALFMARREVATQNDELAATTNEFTDCSNHLASAQSQLHENNLLLNSCSNRVAECMAAVTDFSNQLTTAQGLVTQSKAQIEQLSHQLTTVQNEKAAAESTLKDCTNRLLIVTAKLVSANTNLIQAAKDYALLENRFRRDVAERMVVERKFNLVPELEAQRDRLLTNAGQWATAKNIYDSLDVEINSNGIAHVIAPE
jgi:chromosome segregation ATPase